MRALRLNNTERSQWIDNEESLYLWWKDSRQSKRNFIADNREEIDRVIFRVLNGYRPKPVYQAYSERELSEYGWFA